MNHFIWNFQIMYQASVNKAIKKLCLVQQKANEVLQSNPTKTFTSKLFKRDL